ncbi:MAG: uracil-DNA glycosylase [Chlamydiia bacterium]
MTVKERIIDNTILEEKLLALQQRGKVIYPPREKWFRAIELSPVEATRVLILGQDPYHGEGQANGLAFSVEKGVPLPPSLRNIFLELQADLGVQPPQHGDLSNWAAQGVLLLNTILTVEKDRPLSHELLGWQEPVFKWVAALIALEKPLVVCLWGKKAEKFFFPIEKKLKECHLVLKANHPSPLSAYRGFFGSRPFSKINRFLLEQGLSSIDWQI